MHYAGAPMQTAISCFACSSDRFCNSLMTKAKLAFQFFDLLHPSFTGGKQAMGHGLIAWIVIGIVAGWLTGKLMRGAGFGMFVDMIVGLIGALVGGFLSSHLGMGGVNEHGLVSSIIIATIGAVVLTFLLRLVTGNRTAVI